MNQFVQTSVSRRIHSIIDLAVDMDGNAAIIGAPGVGKTMALDAYRSSSLRISRLAITPIIAGSQRVLISEICECIGMSTYLNESIYEMERALKRRFVGDHLLIIDEAQNLPLRSLRQLLAFSHTDGGDLRFVFCGNADILKQVNTDQGALAQISRRIKFRETIDSIDDDDADAITNSFGVEGLNAYRLMRSVGQHFHADGVVQVLQMAKRFADRETIKAQHIQAAIGVLSQYHTALEVKRGRRKSS